MNDALRISMNVDATLFGSGMYIAEDEVYLVQQRQNLDASNEEVKI